MNRLIRTILITLAFVALPAFAQKQTPKMDGVGIDDVGRLGQAVPLDLTVVDEAGEKVSLSKYFIEGRPVILSLVYYNCPGLCQLEMQYVYSVVRDQRLEIAKDYTVLNLSFDHREDSKLAAKKKANQLRGLERDGVQEGWHFLTADEATIKQLTDAVGFRFAIAADGSNYSHDSALIILTPNGRISKYLHRRAPGSDAVAYKAYAEPTVRYSLIEASAGKVGSASERFWVSICGYDAKRGEYVMLAQSVMALGGGATLIGVLGLIGLFWWIDRKKRATAEDV
jgi:protein SCO1/2